MLTATILSSIPLFVTHLHNANRARFHDRQRMDGFLSENQRVQRITVIAECARDEAVVGRIVDCAEEHTVT